MRVLPNHAAGERPALFLNGREGERWGALFEHALASKRLESA